MCGHATFSNWPPVGNCGEIHFPPITPISLLWKSPKTFDDY